jgi:FkbM family methyltransferase
LISNRIKSIIIKIKGLIPLGIKTYLKKLRDFNGYNQLDLKMLKYINYKNGFFIECGANDGVNQSNTWYFEKKLNWKGILIEPVKTVFEKLKKNRSSNNYFFNNILTSSTNKRKFIKMIYNNKDTLVTKSEYKPNTRKFYINAKTKTLNRILDKIKAPKKIDFFSLDVEGDELNVLKGIDFKRYHFLYILIETNQFYKIQKFLQRKYKFEAKLSDGDYLFKYRNYIKLTK